MCSPPMWVRFTHVFCFSASLSPPLLVASPGPLPPIRSGHLPLFLGCWSSRIRLAPLSELGGKSPNKRCISRPFFPLLPVLTKVPKAPRRLKSDAVLSFASHLPLHCSSYFLHMSRFYEVGFVCFAVARLLPSAHGRGQPSSLTVVAFLLSRPPVWAALRLPTVLPRPA